MIQIPVGQDQKQQRLDRFLKKYLPKASLSHIYKIIRKDARLNGKRVKPEVMLQEGDVLALYLSHEEIADLSQEKERIQAKKQFGVIFEDENLLAVNKPKGLLTHGDGREKKNTLANQVIDYLAGKGEYVFSRENTFTPAPANRLDRNTSGIVLFGKNNEALQALNEMIREKDCIRKYYLAAAWGVLPRPLRLTGGMVKDESRNRIEVVKEGEGKLMQTVLIPLAVKDGYSLIQAELITGRTHQIRAHMASQRLYILGDGKYGSPKANQRARERFGLTSQFLHACRLEIVKGKGPLSDLAGLTLTAPLPAALNRIKDELFGEE